MTQQQTDTIYKVSWLQSIRSRLLLAVALLVALIVVTLTFLEVTSRQESIKEARGVEFHNRATSNADFYEATFEGQLNALTMLASSPAIKNRVRSANAAYRDSPEETEQLLQTLDRGWRDAVANGRIIPLIQQALEVGLILELDEFQQNFNANTEVMLTDAAGAIVAATAQTSDYYQADEAWWQAAYNDGDGAVYISDTFTYDESIGANVLVVALPIRVDGVLVGVLRTNFIVAAMQGLIMGSNFGDTGQAMLVRGDGTVLAASDPTLFGTASAFAVNVIETEAAADGSGTKALDLRNDFGVQVLASSERIDTGGANAALDVLDWYVVIYQSRSEALAELGEVVRGGVITGLAILAVSLTIALFVARFFTNPLLNLTEAARDIGLNRNWSRRVTVSDSSELGVLARTFNQMAAQVQDVLGTLEERVTARTRDMETVAQVAAQTSTILEVGPLLNSITNLTKEQFNLYHAHIYLLDEADENLVLAAGAGSAGRQMVARGHKIPLNRRQSLVARAAREHQGVIINDVTQSPDFLANPLLPDTRAEMAIPMIVGERVVGVLDIQSEHVDRFDEADIRVQTALAGQIAVAVQNARAYEDIESSLRQMEISTRVVEIARAADNATSVMEGILDTLVEAFTADNAVFSTFDHASDSWRGFAGAGAGMTTDVARGFVDPGIRYPHGLDAIRTGHAVGVDSAAAYPGFPQDMLEMVGIKSVMTIPVFSGQSALGVIFLNYNTDQRVFSPEDITLADMLSGQISLNMERWEAEQQRELYTHVTNNTPTAMMVYRLTDPNDDTSLIVEAGNPAAEVIIPEPMDQIIGKKLLDVFPMIAGTPIVPVYANAARGGESVDLGILPFANEEDGGMIHLAMRAFPLPDYRVGVSFDDVTERVVQEEVIRKRALEMQAVAEVSTDATQSLNISELLWDVTDLVKERFDLYHAHVYLLDETGVKLMLVAGSGEAGRRMVEQGHMIPMERTQSLVARAARTREGVIGNHVRENPDFLPNPLLPKTQSEMAVPMIVGDELIGVLDVQSIRPDRFSEADVPIKSTLAAQIAVAVQNARLFAETQRQAEIERANAEQLREVDRLKSQFLANMSHELRTPLNSIIGYSEVLLDGVDGELTEDAEEDVQAIHSSGKHLLSIINEILDLAKIEAGQMQLDAKPVDLCEFAAEVVRTAQVLVKDKTVELGFQQECDIPMVRADAIRLRQILFNLVSNAVKFTERGSVRVHLDRIGDQFARVRVEDTGIGMSEEQLSMIFQRFSQVDGSSTRRAGGTGLGLTITRQLIEMHGGEIGVESEANVGSTFWFTLPVTQPEPLGV